MSLLQLQPAPSTSQQSAIFNEVNPDITAKLLQACQLAERLHLRTSLQWASTALATFRKPSDNPAEIPITKSPFNLVSSSFAASSSTSTSSVFKMPFPPSSHISESRRGGGGGGGGGDTQSPKAMLLDPAYNQISVAMHLQRYKEAMYQAQLRMELHPELRFIHFYARYLHNQRLRCSHSESANGLTAADKMHFQQMLTKLAVDLQNAVQKLQIKTTDAPLLFLLGKIQAQLLDRQSAMSNLIECLRWQPLLIEAWLVLAECMATKAEVVRTSSLLPAHFLRHLFLSKAYSRIGLPDKAMTELTSLRNLGFADNPDVLNDVGKLLTNIDVDESMVLMQRARHFNRLRMVDVEHYSHLLFIRDDLVTMRLLMEDVFEAGRFTPHCSIALGNFYGLLSDHQHAVISFMKALKFNPELHHVWTLVGHEHVELKQTEQAMRCYMRAVQADAREYRAWYGLGQTLEIMRAHVSALYYFKKAFEYCPNDTRMLLALGDTYAQLQANSDAEMCYWRAWQINNDVLVLVRLARLFERLGRYGRAAEIYVKYTMDVEHLAQQQQTVGGASLADRDDAEDLGGAYLYLAKYYLLHRLFDEAAKEATNAQLFLAVKDESHALLKQISRMRTEFQDGGVVVQQKIGEGRARQIDPIRLGFPLWKDTETVEED